MTPNFINKSYRQLFLIELFSTHYCHIFGTITHNFTAEMICQMLKTLKVIPLIHIFLDDKVGNILNHSHLVCHCIILTALKRPTFF